MVTTRINNRFTFVGSGDMCILRNEDLELPEPLQERLSFAKMAQANPTDVNLQEKFVEHLQKVDAA